MAIKYHTVNYCLYINDITLTTRDVLYGQQIFCFSKWDYDAALCSFDASTDEKGWVLRLKLE